MNVKKEGRSEEDAIQIRDLTKWRSATEFHEIERYLKGKKR